VPYWSLYSKPRMLLYSITVSKYFDLAIAGVIGLNVITMALEFYLMPKVCLSVSSALHICHLLLDPEWVPKCYRYERSFSCCHYQIIENSLRLCRYAADFAQTFVTIFSIKLRLGFFS